MWKFEKEFRKDNPQTIGETDKHFDLDNYKDWLENQFVNYVEWLADKNRKKVDIYSMKLHDVISVSTNGIDGVATSYCSIMRVASGWIYQFWNQEKQDYDREIFVPFDNQFINTK